MFVNTSRLIREDFLQQNSFTKYDKYCPFYKSVEMMRNIVTFHRLATAVQKAIITCDVIRQRLDDVLLRLSAQKFEDPELEGEEAVRRKLRALNAELEERFREIL